MSEMEVVVVRSSDGSITPAEVANKLSTDLVGEGGFCSLLDWGLDRARLEGGLGKRLLLPPSDTPVILRILLQQVEKETSGDSNYIVSDLIELERKVARIRGEGGWPQEGEEGSKVEKAAALYKGYLKKNGLVDAFEVMAMVGDLAKVVLWGVHADEAALLEKIGRKQVSLADVKLGEVSLISLADHSKLEEVKLDRETEDFQSLVGVAAFLRILVNPKDNLAVARAFTSSALLTSAQFTEVTATRISTIKKV